MRDDPKAVVIEADLDACPDQVWRAFSEPGLSSRWLAEGQVRTTPGERFSLEDDGRRIDCEVLDAEPGLRLRLSWRDADDAVSSEVTFVFTPNASGGTHLRIVHGPVLASLAVARSRVLARRGRANQASAIMLRVAA
jgi:uncharacterized protein YndB with AHSA1/START domain